MVMIPMRVSGWKWVAFPPDVDAQLRLDTAEVNGVQKLAIWIKALRPHKGLAGNRAEVILDFDAAPNGIIYRATIDGKSVELLFVLLAVGTEPFDPSWIHLAFAGNEHQHGVYGGLLENLTTQDTIAIAIIGDSGNIELDGTIPNTIRQFAREGLADMSKLAPWSDEEWRAAILFFQRENPDILGLWNRFSHLPRTDFD